MVGVSSHGLTEKTLLDLSIALVIIIIVIILFSSSILLTSYENLESDRVRGDVQLIKNNLKVALGGLKSLAIDVGAWDDSYTFALGKNPSFISKNYGKETFVKQNINIVIFTSARGDILYAQGYDNDSNELVPVPRRVLDEAGSVNSPLRNLTPEGSALGLFSTDDSVLLITSYPIVHTDFSGPAAGTVIIGKGRSTGTLHPGRTGSISNGATVRFFRISRSPAGCAIPTAGQRMAPSSLGAAA
jgi:sensor domain CHASE-containing protein